MKVLQILVPVNRQEASLLARLWWFRTTWKHKVTEIAVMALIVLLLFR